MKKHFINKNNFSYINNIRYFCKRGSGVVICFILLLFLLEDIYAKEVAMDRLLSITEEVKSGSPIYRSLVLGAAATPIGMECTAKAGTVTATLSAVCLENGTATISVSPNGDRVVPENYEILYLLTSANLTVFEASSTNPTFVVNKTGDYIIHTLVAEMSDESDPDYITLQEVFSGQQQTKCASLDVVGAPIKVGALSTTGTCDVVPPCIARAGTITATVSALCLENGTATLSATPNGDQVVPANYEVWYLLTSENLSNFEGVSEDPTFEVSKTGNFIIHTLIAELNDESDPNYTTLQELLSGQAGDKCASLDIVGAPIEVGALSTEGVCEIAVTCTAKAGTLTATATEVCLENGTATLSATPNGDQVVPENYEVSYLLTRNNLSVLVQVQSSPTFTVTDTGAYIIHTIIAESSDPTDPNYINVNDFLNQSFENKCASLDINGAGITVATGTATCPNTTTNCVTINTAVWLEGAYAGSGMSATLNNQKYLPGQQPSTFFGKSTPAGQPYNRLPWNYNGTEGDRYDYTLDNGLTYPATVVDWVLVSVRTDDTANTTEWTQAALLHTDGRIEFVSSAACPNLNTTQDYYIVIEHRNHLPVMSHQAVSIVDGVLAYDFRTQQSYKGLFGAGQKQMGNQFLLFAGNGYQDFSNDRLNIVASDKDKWLSSNGKHSGYYLYDYDMNSDTNVQDMGVWLKNNGVLAGVPE